VNVGQLWWMNHERKKHERSADDFERRAAAARDPKTAERFREDARRERGLAKRYDTPGIRF
jgi:hypothetical protein